MAKFRRGHSGKSGRGSKSSIRFILLIAVLMTILFFLFTYLPGIYDKYPRHQIEHPADSFPGAQVRHYLPAGGQGEPVHHRYYSLSYSESNEQAEWVAYALTREMLNAPKVERTDWFVEDPAVKTKSAHYEDYRSSGYTRGHLVPAADMAFSKDAMDDTFLMSNISPQDRGFNMGVWRELEENTRDWAKKYGRLYIAAGPVLKNVSSRRLGRNQVAIPGAFFKVIVSDRAGSEQGVGFLIPNASSDQPLSTYMVTIDEVESATGLDFNQYLFDDDQEEAIERKLDKSSWPISLSRFQKRVREWNDHEWSMPDGE